MTHVKRLASPKTWTIPRKGTKYVLGAYPGKKKELTIALGMLIRDFFDITSTKKETRAFLKAKEAMVDGKIIEEEKYPISLFDNVGFPKMKKFYRIIINELGKIGVEEIKESEMGKKAYKVIGKTALKNGKLQLNLFNGRNVLTDKKIMVNDSVVMDLEKNAVLKHLPLKVGAKVYITGGSHLGSKGVIENVSKEYIQVKISNQLFDIKLDNIYVLE